MELHTGDPLADGEHSLTVTTTDPAGNVSEPSAPIAITVDTTVPTTPAIAGATDDAGTITGSIPADGVTDDTTPTLNGTTEVGAIVDVYDNGTKIGTVTADDAGAWSFTPETPLADGEHSLTVTTTDEAGNVSEPSAPLAITVDTTVPTTPAIAGATDDAGTITGSIPADGVTDDTTPTLNGTTEAGATVDVYDNGTKIGTVTADDAGAWSFTPETPLADGEHSLTVTTTDEAGNVSEPSAPIAITVDTTVPTTPAIAGATDDAGTITGSIPVDGVTDDTTPTLNGTTEAGAIVDVYDNSTKIGTVTADDAGAWSFTPETPLADGEHSLTVTTTDPAGNVSEPSAPIEITVDTTVPATPAIAGATDDAGTMTGSIPADGVTDDTTPTLNGTTEAGATVDVYDNGTKIGTVTADETGAWSFTPETPLADGDHSLTVTTTDPAGNVSEPSAPIAITVDTTVPTTPAIAGATDDAGAITGQIPADGLTDDTTPTLNGTTEAGASVDVYDNGTKIGTVAADETGAWSFTPETPLADGDHSLTVTTTDAAGNVSDSSAAVAFTVDTTVPAAPVIGNVTDDVGITTGPVPADGVTDDATPTLNGTTEAGATVDVYDGTTKIGTVTADETGAWSFTPETPLSDGDHNLTVTTTDAAGNVSDPSAPVAFTVDTTTPTTPIIAGTTDDVGPITGQIPAGGATDDATPTLTGTTEAGATVDVYDSGTKIGTVTADDAGAWSFTPETPLADGDHSLTVTTTDAAGNVSDPSAPVAFTVDTTAPTTPVIAGATDDVGATTGQIPENGVTDDATPTITGTTEAGATVDVYDDGTKIGTVTADETGAWSFTPETPLADGDHSLTVTTTDAAGNVSDPSAPVAFTVDTTAPTTPIIAGATDDAGPITGQIPADGATDDTTPSLSGTTEPGDIVDVYDNGAKIGTVTADETGAWSFTPETPLAEGDHSLTVTTTDSTGNVSDPSDPVALTIDTTAPTTPVIAGATDDVGATTGQIPENGVTDDATPTITGTTEAGATVDVYDDGTKIGTVTADETGAWSFTPETPLADGDHSLTVTTTDAAGNVSDPSAPVAFTVDTTAPTTPIIAGATDDAGPITGQIPANGVTDDTTPTITGTTEAGATVDVFDDGTKIGTVTADETGAWSFTPETPLAEGEHSVTTTATDAAGNVSEPSTPVAFTVDTTPPDVSQLAITGVLDDVGTVTGNVDNGLTTDDASPVIQGTGTAGDTVIVSVTDPGGAREIGRATVGEDGAWSLQPEVPLNTGSNSISAVEVDEAGNATSPSAAYVIVVDTAVPAAPVIASIEDDVGQFTGTVLRGGLTDDTLPTIGGTGDVGSTINVFDGDTLLGSTTVDENGNWTFIPATGLDDGTHVFTATATNPVGQTSVPSASWSVLVDTVAPGPITGLLAADDAGARTGILVSGDVTDDTRPEFHGEAEPLTLVEVFDNGVQIGGAVVGAGGEWGWLPATPLTEGEHSFTFVVVDFAGNSSAASDPFDLIVDTTAPAAPTIGELLDNAGPLQGPVLSDGVTDDNTPTLSGTTEAGALVDIYDGGTKIGTVTADETGAWSFTPETPLTDGDHSVTVAATDAAGNTGAPTAAVTFTVDTAVLEGPVTSEVIDDAGTDRGAIPEGSRTDDATPTFIGTTEPGATVDIYDDGERIGTVTAADTGAWSFTPATPLDDGEHSITMTTTDERGVVSDPTAPFLFVVDTIAPAVPVIDGLTDNVGPVRGPIADGSIIDDATPTSNGTAEPGTRIAIFDNGEQIGTVMADDAGNWSFTPETPLAEGPHSLTVTTTDEAGNTSEASAPLAFTLDTTAPAIPAIAGATDDVGATTGLVPAGGVTDDATPTLTGTTEAGATVELYDNGTKIGTVTADDTGAWSFTPETALAEGDHSLTVTTTDPAGNVSEPSAAIAFAIDVTVPESPAIDGLSDDGGATTGAIPSGGVTDDATPTLAGTTEAGATVDLYDNGTKIGTVTADENGAWSFTPETPLADGDHSLTVTSTDAAGNTSEASSSLPFTVDTTAPAGVTGLTVADDVGAAQGALSDGGVTDDSRPEFGGQAEAGSTVEVYDNGTLIGQAEVAEDGTWRLEPAEALTDGAHAFTTVVVDAAGNRGEASAALNVTLDTSAVLVQIAEIVDDVGPTTGNIVPEG
ncbi:hypothetical protein DFLDMN_000344 [Cupriavidus sp. H19C3]|uniref:Ig-like domain-containing protein n=1 Tax=Cupriavidus sp. H19C3 TaxID=3241603 RepID=UPI003BF7B0F7